MTSSVTKHPLTPDSLAPLALLISLEPSLLIRSQFSHSPIARESLSKLGSRSSQYDKVQLVPGLRRAEHRRRPKAADQPVSLRIWLREQY